MNKKLMRICASGTALAVTASVLSLSVYAAPAKYSAVEQGYITSVKDQGNWGICWAFSSTAISEASLIKEFPDKFNSGNRICRKTKAALFCTKSGQKHILCKSVVKPAVQSVGGGRMLCLD